MLRKHTPCYIILCFYNSPGLYLSWTNLAALERLQRKHKPYRLHTPYMYLRMLFIDTTVQAVYHAVCLLYIPIC